jgi:hypothetical protein
MLTFNYSQTIQAINGTGPFSWSIASGVLPHNLTLGASTSAEVSISGMPDTAESQTFEIQAKDSSGKIANKSYTVTIKDLVVLQVQPIAGQVPSGTIEIQGLSAGPFNPSAWQQGTFNWVPDVRVPFFASLTTGTYQNVYSPWPLEQSGGWRMFYGGWDGTDFPNDQVYSVTTRDFLTFGSRSLVIAHGQFEHVNNVNVQQLPDGSLHMICTVLPSPISTDKPGYFFSSDGMTWNGSPEPYSAQTQDEVNVTGDPLYGRSDYNGGNVLLWDNDSWTLYYSKGEFGAGNGNIYRAISSSPPAFKAAGTAIASGKRANDVKKFQLQGQNWYLMLLYYLPLDVGASPASFTYSISNDAASFAAEQLLFGGSSAADKFITTPAIVSQSGRVLGVLYGGDPYDFLDGQNQIFARWLQKKVVIQDPSGAASSAMGGYGPDREWFAAPGSGTLQGTMSVYGEDGITPIGTASVNLSAGKSYQLVVP